MYKRQIQAAVDAAADGDTIRIADGSYAGFVVDGKDLAVTADNAATVQVDGTSRVMNLGSGQQVLLRKLFLSGQNEPALVVEQAAGAVWIEECSLTSGIEPGVWAPGKPGLVADGAADVRVLRSLVQGGHGPAELFLSFPGQHAGAGIEATGSALHVVDSTVTGGQGGSADIYGLLNSGSGGDAVRLAESQARVWGSTLTGGNGGYTDYCFCPGGLVCGLSGHGGNVFAVTAPPGPGSIELLGATITPGLGGPSGTLFGKCSDGAPGANLVGLPLNDVIVHPGPFRGYWTKSPVDDGGTATLFLEGEPGDVALIALGAPLAPTPFPGAIGPLYLAPNALFVFIGPWAPGVLDPLSVPVPQQPAGFETLRLFTQGAVVTTTGEIRLLAPASLVLIDDGI